jgi:hypothetical protein
VSRTLAALLAVALLAALAAGLAQGERTQKGSLIASLDGGLSPLKLPRRDAAPVTVRLDGQLRTSDGSQLPRVTQVELALAGRGVLSTRGLPVCSTRQLLHTTDAAALAACGPSQVGHGRLEADVLLPNQKPFTISAHLLAFNGRGKGGGPVVLVHAVAPHPPTSVIVPFVVRHRPGGFSTALVANLSPALGPWPHFARFQLTLGRRFSYRGQRRSYLSATCPVPKILTAGFLSFAQASYTLAGGGKIGTQIVRGCRAR